MVFMLRLIPGLLLFFLITSEAAEVTKPLHNKQDQQLYVQDQNTTNEENDTRKHPEGNYDDITSKDVENIVKPFKFARTNAENTTSIKLKKSESYTTTQKPIHENSRTGSGRSVDIDIEKYISPDFYNAVHTLPISTNTKQYASEEEFNPRYSTEEVSSFENLGHLTTPKTPYFDQKYKETVDSVNQKLEAESLETDFDNLTQSFNYSSDNLIEELDKTPKDTKIDYKNVETIELNKTEKPHGKHRDVIQQTQTTLSVESKHNKTVSYDETTPNEDSNDLHKENVKYLLGNENINEVRKEEFGINSPSTVRTNFHLTTKRYSITKPPTDKSDAGIISNKIENETLKSLPVTTPIPNSDLSKTEVPTNRPNITRRGSVKFADYIKLGSTTVPTSRQNRTLEQVVQENQIVPVQVIPPSLKALFESSTNIITLSEEVDFSTSKSVKTKEATITTDNVSPRNNTVEPEEQQSTTVLIIVQPDDLKHDTTTVSGFGKGKTTTIASVPRGFSLGTTTDKTIPTTELEETTSNGESVTSLPSVMFGSTTTIKEGTTAIIEDETTTIKEEVTTSKEETTTIKEETTTMIEETTSRKEDITTFKDDLTTAIAGSSKTYSTEEILTTEPLTSTISTLETSTLPLQTTTGTKLDETTLSEPRSSKDIKFSNISSFTTTESMIDSTTNTIDVFDTTTLASSDETTTKSDTTSVKDILIESTTTSQEHTTVITLSKITSSELTTKITIESTPTKTLLENQTNDDKTTQETKTTPTTGISFVHIKNIDKNHTTLLPDVLKPNEMYTTPITPSEVSTKSTTEAATTTDDTTTSGLDGPNGNNGAIVAIIISCVGGVCLIALACLLVVMRNRQQRFNYGQRCRPVSLDDYSVDNVSVFNSVRRKAAVRDSKRSYGNPAFEDPVCVSHPLTFPAISKFTANEEDVAAEFGDIPQIIARTSELPEGCETKNRYANVIPLPESRVFLNHMDGYRNSDYINANYVTGPKNIRKYYIACQAPMSNTVDDFWRMIWEQQSKVILMLTHLFENGAEKCFDYLPPSEVLDCHRLFGDFQVTLKKREVKEKYIISSIQLKNMVSNSWREVTHFWYMGWPEKGVPPEANSIIAFLIEARSFMKSATLDKKNVMNGNMNGTNSSSLDINPVVVHCSPGTGRTGAVITCDIAIREFEQTRQVDIPKIVYKIRRDRANAVQTKEQYAFIYKVIDLYATKLAGGSLESI